MGGDSRGFMGMGNLLGGQSAQQGGLQSAFEQQMSQAAERDRMIAMMQAQQMTAMTQTQQAMRNDVFAQMFGSFSQKELAAKVPPPRDPRTCPPPKPHPDKYSAKLDEYMAFDDKRGEIVKIKTLPPLTVQSNMDKLRAEVRAWLPKLRAA